MQRPPEEDIDKILAASSRIAVLENVMNPTNMGALFRSAAALGIDAVLVTEGGCENLSAMTPRTIDAIEDTMRQNFVAF